jgi:hypothetical protein
MGGGRLVPDSALAVDGEEPLDPGELGTPVTS